MDVKLTAKAVLAGTFNCAVLTGYMPWLATGAKVFPKVPALSLQEGYHFSWRLYLRGSRPLESK